MTDTATMPLSCTQDQRAAISALMLVDKTFREKFLLHPVETVKNYLGITLSDADAAAIRERADEIRAKGQAMDQQMAGLLGPLGGVVPFIIQESPPGSGQAEH